jgi:stage V sporulation protein SpoVS
MLREFSRSVTADTAVVTTAETAAITTDAVTQSVDGEAITIKGQVGYLTGTGTTAVTVRVRQGTDLTGSVVGETLPVTIGAALDTQIPFQFTTSPNGVVRQSYTVSIQATGASANGTIKSAAVSVALG